MLFSTKPWKLAQFSWKKSNRKLFKQSSKSKPFIGGLGHHKIDCRADRHLEQLLTLLLEVLVQPYLQTHISFVHQYNSEPSSAQWQSQFFMENQTCLL